MTAISKGLVIGLTSFVGLLIFYFILIRSNDEAKLDISASSRLASDLMVPDFSFPDLKGIAVSSLAGSQKVKIIHFWASWCSPCLEEFPSLLKFNNLNSESVVTFAISVDESKRDVGNFVKAFGQIPENFKVLLDPQNSLAVKMGTVKLPESYVFSKDGKLLRKFAGSVDWSDPRVSVEIFGETKK